MANVYFLFLAFLQVIPEVTTSDGIPTYLPPLLFIVLLTMVKDAYEDYKRYKSDQEENNKETLVYRNGSFETAKWKDVRVGDVLKVVKDQFFPADMVMLSSSLFKRGLCFIETKNLDGETNLKNKAMCDDLKGVISSDQQVSFLELDSLSSRQYYQLRRTQPEPPHVQGLDHPKRQQDPCRIQDLLAQRLHFEKH